MTVTSPSSPSSPKHAAPQLPFLVSAPGKVILFGEHAAVYGKPAIAAALSLRTYLLVSRSLDPTKVELNFPDISFRHSWKVQDFPWAAAEHAKLDSDSSKSALLDELVPELVSAVTNILSDISSQIQYALAYAFVYLYTNLCSALMSGLTFTVRSTLPIGAGLGLSASLAVCLATALALAGGHIAPPTGKITDRSLEGPEPGFVDTWSFLAEKCIHGNPLGIDNAVACYGGAVMFQRMKSLVPSVRTAMRNFPALRLLLTNTRQPRRTADLVSRVSTLITDFPKALGAVLDAIDHVTKEGYKLMVRPFFDADAKTRFRELIRMNHGLLVALGVLHPTLERVRLACDQGGVGDTKLTGAGGGGCAITLLRDNVDPELVAAAEAKLQEEGFETFETTLGGKGVGVCYGCYSIEELGLLEGRQAIEKAVGVELNRELWRFY